MLEHQKETQSTQQSSVTKNTADDVKLKDPKPTEEQTGKIAAEFPKRPASNAQVPSAVASKPSPVEAESRKPTGENSTSKSPEARYGQAQQEYLERIERIVQSLASQVIQGIVERSEITPNTSTLEGELTTAGFGRDSQFRLGDSMKAVAPKTEPGRKLSDKK